MAYNQAILKSVIIIHSASDERIDDVDTLRQAHEISEICYELGLKVAVVNIDEKDFLDKLSAYHKEEVFIFNLVETFHGSDCDIYRFTSLLDTLNLKYSGASTDFLFATRDKIITKKILRDCHVKTAKWFEEEQVTNAPLDRKYIVKSLTEHCSFGIDDHSINDRNLANIIAQKKAEFGKNWFAEEYIDGMEFNVAILKMGEHMQVLPIPEMVFADDFSHQYKIVHYEAKWNEQSDIYDKLQRKFYDPNHRLAKKLSEIALRVADIFKINSYARIDFRVDENEEPYVIDINANPCLSADAGFMAAAQQFNLSAKDVILNIIKNSYE